MTSNQLPSLVGALALGGFVVSLVAYGAWTRRTVARARRAEQEAAFGAVVERERDFRLIGTYARLQPVADGARGYELGERAWRDLGMDAVFARLDRCVSVLGQQMLYRTLRTPWLELDPLLAQERRAKALARDPSLRAKVTDALRPLGQPGAYGLAQIVFGSPPAPPRGAALFPYATALTIAAALLSFAKPVALLLLVALILGNVAIRMHVFRDMSAYADGLRHVAALVDAGRRLARLDAPGLSPEIERLRVPIGTLGARRATIAWLTLDRARLDEMSAMVVEYVNTFFLLDVNAFVKELAFARERRATLVAIFEAVAEIDVALSTANYCAGERTVRPDLLPTGEPLVARGVRHPLVPDAVANDVSLTDRGYLITGSNMAGKSTFLKAAALQAVLAQTLFLCTSERYAAPFVRVMTLVEIADDLSRGRSHFLVEAETARAMLAAARTEFPCLCIVDELFRGTNTVDRVAAGAAFLRALRRNGSFVLAATHDRELLALLENDYLPHYFAEHVEDGELRFDYLLRAGAMAPRNALEVLRLVGFSSAVLDEAHSLAAIVGEEAGTKHAKSQA